MRDTVYKGFSRDQMEFQFNPRVAVKEYPEFVAQRDQASVSARLRLRSHCNVRYGESPRSLLDIFPAGERKAPVQFYIHGGYWRSGSKDAYSFLAEPFVKAGVTMVLLEYDLCPSVTVEDIVQQVRAAIAWTYRHIAEYGGDPNRLYLSGSSAGGHLVAMALAYDWYSRQGLPRDVIKGAVAVTGVYDLEPVFFVSVNDEIRLTPRIAREYCPMLIPPLGNTPLIIAVGGSETSGWIQMSKDFFAVCEKRGIDCRYLEVPGAHHFSVSAQLADPNGILSRAVLSQMAL